MTNEQALVIFDKSEKCNGEPCPEGLNCNICPYNVTDEEFDEAYETAKNALSKHCASSEQADTKLFNRGYWLMPGEVFISHNVLNEVLNTIIKSINTEQRKIDSTTAENDEAIRTDDHIADSDKMIDQFREVKKKTDDVPDIHVEKIPYKKPEIIHCGDCRWYERSHYCGANYPAPDDFCSWVERRNDG